MNDPEDWAVASLCFDYIEGQLPRHSGLLVVGLCGAQGSGKSTAARQICQMLRGKGIRTDTLSLDDVYLDHADRAKLAKDIHPLLQTRGPPGTHDLDLLQDILDSIRAGHEVTVPVFDKLTDDRIDASCWRKISSSLDVLLFEGWCVGARAQSAAELIDPINDLERDKDPSRVWRQYVNDQLATSYKDIFRTLDLLILLKAPNFEIIRDWRTEQENSNRQASSRLGSGLSKSGIERFVQYYERITRNILSEMQQRCDLLIGLNSDRSVASVTRG